MCSMSERSDTEAASELQNGETFNDEMKDYAKSTMNELLGIFGYKEEITREAVEELQIRLLPEEDEEHSEQKSEEPEKSVTPSGESAAVALDIQGSTMPVIVQVEGCNNDGSTNVVPLNTVTTNNEVKACAQPDKIPVSCVQQAAVVAESVPGKATSVLDQTARSDVCSSEERTGKKELNDQRPPNLCVTYTDPSTRIHTQQNLRQCTWCKKMASLQDFSSSDGEKRVFCKDLCSALCFEKALKSIKDNGTTPKDNKAQPAVLQPQHNQQNDKMTKPVSDVSPTSSSPGRLTRSAARGIAAAGKSDSTAPPKIPMPVGPQRIPNIFSWDDYLAETGAKAAAWNCFKQATTPPYNGFKCGMKLEVADPRIVDTMCVATVVGILGPRIRCRFDGTDSANDVWRLVDSKEIHPVGWCEGNGGRLQPPVGFKTDPGKYSTFLAKSLVTAELAPVRLFKREPVSPKANLFKTGMKLEALDPKNPLLICVATVADVDGDKIRVDFDGYLGSDYWCRFDSRDLFPVGWCYVSGHPLQPPGKSKKVLKAQLNSRPKEVSDKQEKTDNKPAKEEKPEKPEKPEKKKTQVGTPRSQPAPSSTVSSPAPTSSTPSSSSPKTSKDVQGEADDVVNGPTTVQVFINHTCYPGPYLNQARVAGLPSCFRGSVANVARDCIQSVVNAAIDPKVVLGFLKPGNGRTKIVAKTGSKTWSCMLQHIDRVSIFWRVLEKLSDNLQCCENLFCGERMTGPCPKCGRAASRRNTALPDAPSSKNNSTPPGPIKRLHPPEHRQESVKYPRITIEDDDVSSPQVCSSSHPKTWSVDEVVRFIEGSELAEHSDMFRKHEIDGKALLLLTREMIMSYMGLKLGPAIKLLCFIDELKVQRGL